MHEIGKPLYYSVLLVAEDGTPVTSSGPLLRIKRRNQFFDFSDSFFKSSGHGQIQIALTEEGNGWYGRSFSAQGLGDPLPGDRYEFTVYFQNIVEVETLEFHRQEYVRKILDNRLELLPVLNKQVLYDDDGTTILREWEILDSAGGSIEPFEGVPFKRRVL